MPITLSISKITLPSGNTYEIKDAVARQMIAGGMKFIVAWDGESAPVVTKIPAGVKVKYEGQTYTGTLSVDSAELFAFYLVYSSTQESENDVYDEYVVATIDDSTKVWEKLGDTRLNLDDLGALAYKDDVILSKGDGANVLGANATLAAQSSEVTFDSNAGSNFVTGYNNDAVAPTFQEGAFTPASLAAGFVTPGTAPSFTEGEFNAGSLPSFTEGAFDAGALPSFSEGAFDAGSLPSLGASTKSEFAVEGMVAAMGTGNDAETLIFSAANKSNAVTEQGTFSAGSLPSKAADTFSAGSLPTKAADTFSAGSLPSKGADTFAAGAPTVVDVTKFDGGSKAADTFTAGSAATLATAKALTHSDTGTAAAQVVSVDNADSKKVALYNDLSVSAE